jgi:hypothetical protein
LIHISTLVVEKSPDERGIAGRELGRQGLCRSIRGRGRGRGSLSSCLNSELLLFHFLIFKFVIL